MKPQILLVALAAVLTVLAALPLAESKGHGIGERAEDATARKWPCCDSCGSCTRSLPAQCTCEDTAAGGCHPTCKNCVKASAGGSDAFRCADRITNFCKRRCTPAA